MNVETPNDRYCHLQRDLHTSFVDQIAHNLEEEGYDTTKEERTRTETVLECGGREFVLSTTRDSNRGSFVFEAGVHRGYEPYEWLGGRPLEAIAAQAAVKILNVLEDE